MSYLPEQPTPPIVAFYLGFGHDSEGRTIDEIWSWQNDQLEYVHDYIQWLFPLTEKSRFNENAPILDAPAIHVFQTSADLKRRLIKSLELMLGFYGLRSVNQGPGKITIVKSDEYIQRIRNWITFGNHNYLRLTRILASLTTLGLRSYAVALFECLEEIYKEHRETIGNTSYSYWKSAVWN